MAATPGPWRTGSMPSWNAHTGDRIRNVWAGEPEETEEPVAVCEGTEHDVDANAWLIAQAPTMLDLLREIDGSRVTLCECTYQRKCAVHRIKDFLNLYAAGDPVRRADIDSTNEDTPAGH